MGCGQGKKLPKCMGSAVFGPEHCTCPGLSTRTDPEDRVIFVRFSDDGQHIRKWAFKPFDGATEYAPRHPENRKER